MVEPAASQSHSISTYTPKKIQISGTVRYDGQKLPEGEISLQDVYGRTVCATSIKDGRFVLDTTEGLKKVTITAWRNGSASLATQELKSPGSVAVLSEQYLPGDFNERTQLSILAYGGDIESCFLLKSDGEHTFTQTPPQVPHWQ